MDGGTYNLSYLRWTVSMCGRSHGDAARRWAGSNICERSNPQATIYRAWAIPQVLGSGGNQVSIQVSMLISDTIAYDSLSAGRPMYCFVAESSFTPN